MIQDIQICQMTADDLEDVYAIDKESFPIPWSKTSFEDELKNLLASYFVAKDGNKVIGYIGMWCIIDECHVTNIAIASAYRKQGVASKLVKKMIQHCKEHRYFLYTLRSKEVQYSCTKAL